MESNENVKKEKSQNQDFAEKIQSVPKVPDKIKRTDSISGRAYQAWRMFLWKQVTKYLANNDYAALSALYEREKVSMQERQHVDRAGIVMCRKGISTFFNQGLKPSLCYMKRAIQYTDSLPYDVPNVAFIQGNACAIIGFLYIKKNKLGKAWNWLLKASPSRFLQLTEDCEFSAELSYALATFYFKLASMSVGNHGQRNRLLAIRHAEKSRDICADDFDKGEWYAYYTVESLYLLLMIKTNADEFVEKKDFERLSDDKLWSSAKIHEIEKLIQELNAEKLKLENKYVYMDLGISKCNCMLYLRKTLSLQPTKNSTSVESLYDAKEMCSRGLQLASNTHQMCTAYFTANKGCIKAKYVQQISTHFATFQHYFEHILQAIEANIAQMRTSLRKNVVDVWTTSDIATSEEEREPKKAIQDARVCASSQGSSEESRSSGVRL